MTCPFNGMLRTINGKTACSFVFSNSTIPVIKDDMLDITDFPEYVDPDESYLLWHADEFPEIIEVVTGDMLIDIYHQIMD